MVSGSVRAGADVPQLPHWHWAQHKEAYLHSRSLGDGWGKCSTFSPLTLSLNSEIFTALCALSLTHTHTLSLSLSLSLSLMFLFLILKCCIFMLSLITYLVSSGQVSTLTSVFSFVKWDDDYIIITLLSEVMSGKELAWRKCSVNRSWPWVY